MRRVRQGALVSVPALAKVVARLGHDGPRATRLWFVRVGVRERGMRGFITEKGWGKNAGLTLILARSGGTYHSIGWRNDPAEAEAIAAHFNDVLENGLAQLAQREAQLAALRAVVKEARAEIESWPVNDRLEIVANEAAVLAILGRGLTGSEE